jgi:hypothetical protein
MFQDYMILLILKKSRKSCQRSYGNEHEIKRRSKYPAAELED